MRKTKIICTLGPASDSEEMIEKLILTGMNAARFNFSHGTHESHLAVLTRVKNVRDRLGCPVATILDTKGPEIRIRSFANGKIELADGDTFTLTTREVDGDNTIVSVTYPNLHNEVSVGTHLLIDDGLVDIEVTEIKGQDIICNVVTGGPLSNNKSINIPNTHISLPALTEKDKSDLKFAVENDFDFVAASFVRQASDVEEIRAVLDSHGGQHIGIIAKIENQEGVDNIDEILAAADGVMVARGDLGVEIPASDVPHVQKIIIEKCNHKYKPVITATQMLDSMIRNPRPTRAEVSDVANAIYDGTDAVMLSGETAQGKYPVEAVQMMAKIAESSEQFLKFDMYRDTKALLGKQNVSSAVGFAAVTMVERLNASCIVTPTMSGQTARVISNLRPSVPIYGVTPNERTRRKMQLYWGVKPITGYEEDSTENIISHAMYMVVREGLVHKGEMVIFTAGDPATNEVSGQGYMTNMLQVIQAK